MIIKEMEIQYVDGKKTLRFGEYIVIQEKENFNAVYRFPFIDRRSPLTHKSTWKQATKIAKLLEEAYKNGREDEADNWKDYY